MATYNYSDKVVIIKKADGGVGILYPAPDCPLSLEQIIDKDVPKGVPYKIMNASDIPSDQTYFDAWKWID